MKQIASEMYDAGNLKVVLCDSLEGWNAEGGERKVQMGADICIPMVNSC